MPTPEIRRLLAEQEQQKMQAKRKLELELQAKRDAELQAKQNAALEEAQERKREDEERARKKAINENIFKDSGIYDGLKRIQKGLRKQSWFRPVKLLADYTNSEMVLVWGTHYEVSRRDNGIYIGSEFIHGKSVDRYISDYEYIHIGLNLISTSDDSIDSSNKSSVFKKEDWGNQEKVDKWLAEKYMYRRISHDIEYRQHPEPDHEERPAQ